MTKDIYIQKLDDLYNKTLDSEIKYDNKLNNIDYFSAICKATSNDLMIKFQGSNLSMFNYRYNNLDAVLMIFSVPLNSDNSDEKSKHKTERIMDIIGVLEKYFVTLDFVDCKQVKEEKFIYLTVVKTIDKQKTTED